ncbi:leucine-rich repeat domain-containing protein [Chryseobacterium sp. ERMR1:04]|uniref:leucine-rich repeat domain-containing protein n=1 Tax=Chryseobacterium sp. ERMR1:04 TaxID=1705393 RepID=UPI0006C83F13|nr:leucine-rich repeat domain-containing protein [Chryseobacterium sp. ERMR1:04]
MKTKEELKLYFENGDKPTQEHFWQWQDSYWHKEEKIDIAKIAGLENGLPRLNDFYAEIDENGNATLAPLRVINIFIKQGTLHIPAQFAFGNGVSNLSLAESVLTIGNEAFSNNQLKSLIITGNVTTINEHAFSSNQLTSLNIPANVIEIKDYAFAYNQLNSLYIAPSVSKIGPNAFNYNPDMKTVMLDRNTQYYPDSFDPKTRVIGGSLISES